MEKEVRTLIPDGFGLNCGYETERACQLAGSIPERVHLTDLYEGKVNLGAYDILAFIGGFDHGDENGAGVVGAYNFKRHLGEDLLKFVDDGKLVIGICNGFQELIKMGVLPGIDKNYDDRVMSVTYNDCGNFRDQWVKLYVNPDSPCVFTRGIDNIDLPIRHGEGNVIPADGVLETLAENNQIVMRYCVWGIEMPVAAEGRFPDNPNGSVQDIAGICDPTGRVFGLMPHPEAYNHWTNHPLWTRQKSSEGIPDSKEGLGIKIFRNAVEYIQEQGE